MSYGKEIFRGKYKETMDSLNIIKDNYYDLDQEYQCSMKEKNDEIERLNNIINELEKWLEEEQDRLAREISNIYEDSLGKTKLVNEDIEAIVTKEQFSQMEYRTGE